jgi:cell division septation protein DedD
MYGWIWRKLPGGLPGKIVGSLILVATAVVVLFLVVFPWIGPKLPFNHVTVDQPTPPRSSRPAAPT